jgi:hypothetical protein
MSDCGPSSKNQPFPTNNCGSWVLGKTMSDDWRLKLRWILASIQGVENLAEPDVFKRRAMSRDPKSASTKPRPDFRRDHLRYIASPSLCPVED